MIRHTHTHNGNGNCVCVCVCVCVNALYFCLMLCICARMHVYYYQYHYCLCKNEITEYVNYKRNQTTFSTLLCATKQQLFIPIFYSQSEYKFSFLSAVAVLANWGPRRRYEWGPICPLPANGGLASKANLHGSKGWRWEKIPSPLNPAYTSLLQNEDGKQRTHKV